MKITLTTCLVLVAIMLAGCGSEAPPVFDGMIAAQERLFVSLQNGSLVCFGK